MNRPHKLYLYRSRGWFDAIPNAAWDYVLLTHEQRHKQHPPIKRNRTSTHRRRNK